MTKRSWPRRFAIVQSPNLPLLAALASALASRLASGPAQRAFTALFYASLSVWSYEEARHGANWFRRLLGLGVGAYVMVSLADSLHRS